MDRRDFCRRAAAFTAGAFAFAHLPSHLFAEALKKRASDRVSLGPMGVELSRLAMGTGTSGYGGSSDQTRQLGLEGLANLLEAGFDQGVTFWDSADQYGSHPHLKLALSRVPREKVTVLTKTHARTEKEMRADLDRYRKELGTDYLDIVLLHALTDPQWPEDRKGAMAVLAEAREKGMVRTHGVSCHSLGALKTAARTAWVQVDLARINPAGQVMDGSVGDVLAVLREMKKAGKGVIGMKILGAGSLVSRKDECLRYVLGLDCVDCFTIGFQNTRQLDDLVARIPAASAIEDAA
jgi:aryl-alcohol dehydrogenase-like predicted oxidoreductase